MKLSLKTKFVVWALLVAAWLIESLAAPKWLDADAVSYLDIAYSCLAGNWHALANAYWSPAFPFLLALWIKLFHVTPYFEPLAIRCFAFVSLIAALLSFEYFLSVLLTTRESPDEPRASSGNTQALPDAAIQLLGYALFFWITTFLTPPRLEQPDILVLIIYLLAGAISLRLLLAPPQPAWRYALFGAVLGLAYLIKAVMFPLSFVFIATLFIPKDRFRRLPATLLAIAVFFAISTPFIFALSSSKGRLTYGAAGAVNYLHIMGDDADITAPPASGREALPPVTAPHAAQYVHKIDLGTYPPWTDPSFDYKGTPLHFRLGRQLNRIHIVLSFYFALYVEQLAALLAGLLALVLAGPSLRSFAKRFWRFFPLWLPAVAGLALYSLVRVEGRMLAGITIALFAACAAALRIDDTEVARKYSWKIALAVSLVLFAQIALTVGHDLASLTGKNNYPDWQVVTALQHSGIAPGERVSYLGDTLSDHAWAHLARVKIAAEIPPEDVQSFWAASQSDRDAALEWLAMSGAKALVTRNVPPTAMSMGWQKIGDTNYYLLKLSLVSHP